MSREVIPRPAATTLVVRDHAGALQVLMLRRSLSASFMPGSYVFPGGAVDAADGTAQVEARCQESRAEASVRLGLEDAASAAALAYTVAALRECFEECGLWLGTSPIEAHALAAARQRMLAGTADLCAISAELAVPLATRALAPWSHWVTPIDAPKRFDTVFFVTLAPPGQTPAADDGETIALVWVNPSEALALNAGGALQLEFATLRTLDSLLPFNSAAALMHAARTPRRLQAIHPRVARTQAGDRAVLLPQDPGYAEVMRLDPEGTGTAVLPDLRPTTSTRLDQPAAPPREPAMTATTTDAKALASTPSHVPPSLVHDFDLYNVEVEEGDYHAALKRLHGPGVPDIFWTPRNGGHWVATRGEDIYNIFKDAEHFSSRQLVVPRERNPATPLVPIFLDPPEQAKYRALLAPALSPKAVSPLGEGARALAIELIDGFYAKGECEFVRDFAQHLPIGIFMKMVDVPMADRDKLLHWADQQVRPTSEHEREDSFHQLFAYAGQKVAERKANPGTDLISQLTKAQVDGQPITAQALVPMVFLLLVGGLDTVASAMGFAARFLAGNPAHRHELVAHPERIPAAVEELLRRFPVVNQGRLVVSDMDYKGVAMRAGEQIILPTTLHGLDERKFNDPLRVDFSRPTPIHSTFGNGVHRCPGSLLARTELRIFLEEWLKRIPDFSIKPGATPGVRAGVNATIYSLPLVWEVK